MIIEKIKKSRTVRRFVGDRPVSRDILTALVEGARYSPSAVNAQRLRFRIVNDPQEAEAVYSLITLGGALTPEQKPKAHEHATAFIVIVSDSELNVNLSIDLGIAAQSVMLVAADHGLAGCIVRSFRAEQLSELLSLGKYRPHLVLALGYPAEQVEIVAPKGGSLKYYRDESDRHMVPKLPLDELIIG